MSSETAQKVLEKRMHQRYVYMSADWEYEDSFARDEEIYEILRKNYQDGIEQD